MAGHWWGFDGVVFGVVDVSRWVHQLCAFAVGEG